MAWSDGQPYYRDERGRKRYAHHPDHENLARCIGNDVPHLCLWCGTEQAVDSLKPRIRCRKCRREGLVDLWELEGQPCPRCGEGHFIEDPSRFAIS
jgi:Zn finger protein HypA/HybF involved in hydrogenase expression